MKKSVKPLIAALLILVLLFTAVSCGKTDGASPNAPEPASAEAPDREQPTDTGNKPTEPEEPPTDKAPDPATPVTESPLMWRVTDAEGHTLYLFGTIHVGDERSDAVLERVSPVLEGCDALAVEADMVAYENSTQQMMQIMQQYVLTDGSVVSDYIPEELYLRSYALLERAGLSPALFRHYNLAWWTQLVQTAMIMVYSDLDPEKGMDRMLELRAAKKNVPVIEVESVEFQNALLNSFSRELYLMLIESELENTETCKEDINKLYTLWLSGDRDAFWKMLTEDDTEEASYTEEQLALYEDYEYRLTDERNIGMRDKAVEYLNSGKTVFFAVGSLHMANETGLVRLLAEAGYTVEPFSY